MLRLEIESFELQTIRAQSKSQLYMPLIKSNETSKKFLNVMLGIMSEGGTITAILANR
jgi:hypothetical protein